MSAMFLAMVWHARRRVAAIQESEALAESRASLLARQERFLHDVTHELRTPVTIARGHLELLESEGRSSPEVAVALDELGRIERIISRLLLLAKADRPDFLATSEVDVEAFLEDVFMRWSEVAPRGWRLGPTVQGHVWADEEALRIALDALARERGRVHGAGRVDRAARDRGRRDRCSRSPTAAAASRRRPSTGSSTASGAPTTRAPGRTAASVSASRSWPRSRRRTADGAAREAPPGDGVRAHRRGRPESRRHARKYPLSLNCCLRWQPDGCVRDAKEDGRIRA